MLQAFAYVRPRSLPEAIKHLADQGARVHAGGTDLLGCLRDGVFTSSKLVSLGNIQELRGITETGDGVRIGALTTITEIAASPVIQKRYPVLAQAAMEVASPQLRNQGTIGGNTPQYLVNHFAGQLARGAHSAKAQTNRALRSTSATPVKSRSSLRLFPSSSPSTARPSGTSSIRTSVAPPPPSG